MIKYHLKCECGVEFESWFSSSKEYDRLEKKKMLSCQCGKSNNISKQLMAPQITSKKVDTKKNKQEEFYKTVNKKLRDLRDYVEKNAEYVGDNFVSEARSIHYDKKKKTKGIYGTASKKEMRELKEEGIRTEVIPWVDDKSN